MDRTVMAFVDGTNLFYRLREMKARLAKGGLRALATMGHHPDNVKRIYCYTSAPHYAAAVEQHGEQAFRYTRVVLGDAIPTGDGNFKEKAVDAMLVADLVYHAAAKNISHAALVSVDTDFAHAIRRVEDFGCRTNVIGVGVPIPERLAAAADSAISCDRARLLQDGIILP